MKQKNILPGLSDLLIVLSFLYLGIQIYNIVFRIRFWISNFSLLEILFGTFREICEILYIPLWGITIAFSFMLINYWMVKKE
jgi:hypothetical protein